MPKHTSGALKKNTQQRFISAHASKKKHHNKGNKERNTKKSAMKRRETRGAPSADLLVCLPSRSRLTLMPKPIRSPTRPPESSNHHLHYHRRLLKKSSTGKGSGAGSHSSPLLWAKNKQIGPDMTEPTSPKVTCAGQIKVRSKTSSCKSWQSVMEEIEKIHNSRRSKRRPSWVESLGFKKEVVQFLTCLRGIRFDFRCFGSFPRSDITSDDEDEDEEDEEYQENLNDLVDDDEAAIPPPNALLLMRCRSAPAKARQEENEEDENKTKKLNSSMEEKTRKTKESLVVMGYEYEYGRDFYKISTDIAKETWVVGGMKDPLSRSRSWKS